MKNLVSMVDFVFEQINPENFGSSDIVKLLKYANFLKQPLELWMFDKEDERCLFEGCVYDDVMQEIRSEKGIVLFHLPKKELFTVEMMVKYNLRLTPHRH